jgi:hypothetical protein
MLAVALVCEIHKSDWKQLLLEDGHAPYGKLKSIVQKVQEAELKLFLDELLELASPV